MEDHILILTRKTRYDTDQDWQTTAHSANLTCLIFVNKVLLEHNHVRYFLYCLGQEDSLEKGVATHSSILAWRIPWIEEPGHLQSTGSQRIRHD